ncbi:MAG TPA: hypothetical protein VGH36_14620, partial [Acetobacteraceae bacterium]
MVADETKKLQKALTPQLEEAMDAISVLNRHFGRETLSAAIGELSEILVESFTGAKRTQRNTRGYDLIAADGRLIEIKARFLASYADSLQFH